MADVNVKEREHMERECTGDDAHPSILAAGWKTTVKVIALPGDPIIWRIDSKLKGDNGLLTFNKTNDNMPKKDYYLIEFDLVDLTGLNLRFEPNPMKAFWVVLGDNQAPPPCPDQAAYCDSIYAVCDDQDGKSLTVRNDDKISQYFSYSLGFVGDPDGTKYRCDPGGDNQDGGLHANYR